MVTNSVVDQKFDYTLDEAAEAIANVFNDQGWRWWFQGVPTPQDIKDNIQNGIEEVGTNAQRWRSTGRIRVHYDEDAQQHVASVEFYLT